MARASCCDQLGAARSSPSGRARRQRPAAHRHHLPRRAPIAAGHARAHLRHAGHRQLRGASAAQPVQPGDVGRRHLRRHHALPARRSLGCACAACAKPSPTSVSRCCCAPRTPWATPPIPTTWWREFIYEAAAQGIDIFRIFDSLNWLPNMKASMEAVRKTRSVCEAAICYTGDILDPKREKYSLEYYVRMAKELERMGAHILAIKDMAGLCKPYAAEKLVKALREEIGIPIHFHTHDTSGINAASRPESLRRRRGCGRWRDRLHERPDQPAESELHRGRAAHTRRDTGARSGRAQPVRRLLGGGARAYYPPFDTGPKSRHRRGLPARDARRPVHQSEGAGRSPWAWARAGTRSPAPTPTSTWRSATSSR